MTTSIVIIGAGGHARVLLDALQLSAHKVLGFIDPAFAKGTQGPVGLPMPPGAFAVSLANHAK